MKRIRRNVKLLAYGAKSVSISIFVVVLLFLIPSLYGQHQASLLKKAYKNQSKIQLFEFFDNWSDEIASNENDAPNPWVAEAHRVFSAFYQPLQPEKVGYKGDNSQLYHDKPFFILQSSLWEIHLVDSIQIYSPTAFYDYGITNDTLILSDIPFRPRVHFPDRKIVYLTNKYKRILDRFLKDKHINMGQDNIMHPANSKNQSQQKMDFIQNAAGIIYGHWGGYWQYETYPEANVIILDREMNRAIVKFRFVYDGGHTILEKQNGVWVVVSSKFTWIE